MESLLYTFILLLLLSEDVFLCFLKMFMVICHICLLVVGCAGDPDLTLEGGWDGGRFVLALRSPYVMNKVT